MTINQQKLRSVLAQFIADIEDNLSTFADNPEVFGVSDDAINQEEQLVLLAARESVECLEIGINDPPFSFDDPPPPKPQRPRPTLVK